MFWEDDPTLIPTPLPGEDVVPMSAQTFMPPPQAPPPQALPPAGGTDWRRVLASAIPAFFGGMAIRRGVPATAGFVQGFAGRQQWQEEQEAAQAEEARQRAQALEDLQRTQRTQQSERARSVLIEIIKSLSAAQSPEQYGEALDLATRTAPLFGLPATAIAGLPGFSGTKAERAYRTAASKALEPVRKQWEDVPGGLQREDVLNSTIPVEGWGRRRVGDLLAIVGPTTLTGDLVLPPEVTKPRTAPAMGSFEDYIARYAKEAGLPVERLTTQQIESARRRYQQADDRPQTSILFGPQKESNADEIADAIIRGDQPPDLGRLYGLAGPVRAALARKRFDLRTAERNWRAELRRVASLNSTQQVRMYQAASTARHSLDVIDELSAQWEAGRFPPLNKARMVAAMNGALGEDAQVIATQLQAQIATITSEIANVYMGGNSPTDHAMELAARELNANWSMPQLKAATDLARRNLGLRLQSMSETPVLGIGAAGQWKGTGEEEEPSSTPVIPVGPNEPVDYVWSNGRLVKVKKGPR